MQNQFPSSGCQIAETPEQILGFQLLAMRSALRLESVGMRHSSGKRVSVEVRTMLKGKGLLAPSDLGELQTAFSDYLRSIGVLAPVSQASKVAGDPVQMEGRTRRVGVTSTPVDDLPKERQGAAKAK
jgi:hypothetical protein